MLTPRMADLLLDSYDREDLLVLQAAITARLDAGYPATAVKR